MLGTSAVEELGIMRAMWNLAGGIAALTIMSSASGPYAQETKPLPVPNVTVTAPAAPFEPPYMRDPGKAFARNPYFGRYRVEEDKFSEVPCTQTRIASRPGGKCLQGYRLGPPGPSLGAAGNNSSPCDMALDVVIDTPGNLAIEARYIGF